MFYDNWSTSPNIFTTICTYTKAAMFSDNLGSHKTAAVMEEWKSMPGFGEDGSGSTLLVRHSLFSLWTDMLEIGTRGG